MYFFYHFFSFVIKKNKHYQFLDNAYSSNISHNLDYYFFSCTLLSLWEQKARATYEKLIDLQRGHNFISKDGSKVIFEFSLYQRQEEVKEINDNEEIEYFDASDKNVLVALNSHNDIRNLSELLMNYNVNITTAGSVNELNELLSSNKIFDLVFLSDHIYGIDNYDIKNTNDFKKAINKLSLVAGYKLDIVLVTLNDYQKANIEYLTLPISKTKLDDILVKYLNED